MNYHQDIYERYETYNENYAIWQYDVGFEWTKGGNEGRVRLFCLGGIRLGDINEQKSVRRYDYYEYYYEYTSPDTSYSIADTVVREDIDEDISAVGDITKDSEEIGIGFKKSIHNNANFLTGLKICRTRNEMKRTALDNVKTIETDYRVIIPIGGEFFIAEKVIVRGGISLSYTNHSEEEIIGESTKYTDSYIDITHSFGLGVNPTPHFKFDLYNDGYDLANIHNWRIEGIYRF